MKNYSRQREAILNVLRSTDVHPTAATVYERVREIIPNISLGTVYRNLAELSKNGEILSLSVGDGSERFDGDISPHAHLNCRKCGAIADLKLESNCIAEKAKEIGFNPEISAYVVYGVCEKCSSQKNLN